MVFIDDVEFDALLTSTIKLHNVSTCLFLCGNSDFKDSLINLLFNFDFIIVNYTVILTYNYFLD